jgi:GH24 family phage-related lysozyme (muramidase)
VKTSRAGIEAIAKHEGLRLRAYPDPATGGEPWTIGYGHTSAAGLPKVYRGMVITKERAREILSNDLVKFENAVEKALTVNPTQNQFDAMVSLCFNIGPGNFSKSSVLKFHNGRQFEKAAGAFALWNKAAGKVMAGLTARRAAERALYLKG